MTPEEFYKRDRLIKYTHQTVKEMRVRSLDWMLGCFRKGTIRRRTIVNLIPLKDLYYLLKDMEEVERYEDCATIKSVIEEIYEQKSEPNNMTKRNKKKLFHFWKSLYLKKTKKQVVKTKI